MSRQRTAILRSPTFAGHDTGEHPERAARVIAVDAELTRRDLMRDRPEIPFGPASDEEIERVHVPEQLRYLRSVAAQGGGWVDSDTVVREDSVDVALLAAGATVAAVDAVLAGTIDQAFVIARPPGHHATSRQSMGFCLLNAIAIGAAHATTSGLARVAIIDWDVHHGNGTQDIFDARADVLYASIHQWPFYPGTGTGSETGRGDGAGTTVNVPLPAGTTGAEFRAAFRTRVVPEIEAFRPELLFISAGYDAHADDPIGGMRLADSDFRSLTQDAVALAERFCAGRIVAVMEGGYDTAALARCVADAIEVLDGAA